MANKFANEYKNQKVSADDIADFVIYELQNDDGSNPTLKVKPAHRANQAFQTGLANWSKQYSNKAKRSGRSMDDAATLKLMNQVSDLLATHIIVDWKGVFANDKEVKFSKQDCLDYLNHIFSDDLVPQIQEELIRFIADRSNFTETYQEEVEVDEEYSKN